eukprot:COSAG03_NODE_6240_length_1092_cov_1.858006_2_plen_99_part_01
MHKVAALIDRGASCELDLLVFEWASARSPAGCENPGSHNPGDRAEAALPCEKLGCVVGIFCTRVWDPGTIELFRIRIPTILLRPDYCARLQPRLSPEFC